MLALTVRAGEYITIGPDVVIQVLKTGELFRIAIDAPREMAIERSKVRELTHEAPACIQKVREDKAGRIARAAQKAKAHRGREKVPGTERA